MTGVILMYHRVAHAPEDAYGLAVTPSRFAAHAEHLHQLGCVVPLSKITQPTKKLQIAITFDDGYVDNAITAAPLLAKLQLPATYFIASGELGGRHFWWDRLAVGLLEARVFGIDVEVRGRELWLALDSPQARRTSLRFLHRRLRPLPPQELRAIVDNLLWRLEALQPPGSARTMTVEQLRALSAIDTVEIGAHTRTHLQLCGQARELQYDEVFGSKADLGVIIGQPIRSLAYPFGSESAVGRVAPRLARQAGYQLACSTDSGPVKRWTDPYRLPRINVGDWQVEDFAARIGKLSRFS